MSDYLEYKGYKGSIEYSREDKELVGKVLFIDSLLMYSGPSVEEITSAFENVIDDYIAHCERNGVQPNKAFSGSFNVRVGPELHRKAVLAAKQSNQKLNEFVRDAIGAWVNKQEVTRVEVEHRHILTFDPQSTRVGTTLASMGISEWEEGSNEFIH